MAKTKGGLGKGLEALFVDNTTDTSTPTMLGLGDIEPNREQPRKQFESSALADLADSIREYGVIQPLVVRPMPDGTYQLVAGERRWRAARMAGLTEVPVVIKDLTDAQTMELALIENLQREDLNAIEEATGYHDLMEKFGLTQEQVSARVGKSRPVITNALRLLSLPESVQEMLQNGQITAGHARSLISLEDEELICQIAKEIVNHGLSVRQIEAIAKKHKNGGKQKTVKTAWDQSFYAEVQLALSQSLSRKIKVQGDGKKGKLTIEFYDENDLKSLVTMLNGIED